MEPSLNRIAAAPAHCWVRQSDFDKFDCRAHEFLIYSHGFDATGRAAAALGRPCGASVLLI
jgi:hypothetical protein